jgi:uncharacterized membrane protein YdjX (TVP38/TMEM64 family)
LKDLFLHNRKTLFYLSFITIIQILLTSSIIGFILHYDKDFLQLSLSLWLGIYLGFAFCMTFSFIPNSFVAFLGGFFLNVLSIPLFLVSYFMAICIGFVIAGKIDNGNFSNSLIKYPKIQQILHKLQDDEILLVMFARFSPVFPFAIMNQVLYSSGVKFSTFLWASFVGMLPRMLLMTYFGSQAANLAYFDNATDTQKLSQLLFLMITLFGILWIFKRISKKVNL